MSEAASASPAPRVSEVKFTVKGAPLGQNQAWDFVIMRQKGGGPGHISKTMTVDGKTWKIAVAQAAALARPPAWDRENEYIVECVYFFADRRPDHDGPGKLTFDALAAFEIEYQRNRAPLVFTGLMKNDRQIWKSSQQKELDPVNPRAEITVKLRRPWRPQQVGLGL